MDIKYLDNVVRINKYPYITISYHYEPPLAVTNKREKGGEKILWRAHRFSMLYYFNMLHFF